MGAKRQGDRHGDGSEAQRHGEEDEVALCLNRSRLYLLLCLFPVAAGIDAGSDPKQNTVSVSRNFMDGYQLFVFLQVLCEKYWPPEGGTVYYGLIQVTTISCKQGPDYFITSINLRQVR